MTRHSGALWLATVGLGFACSGALGDELAKVEKELVAAWERHESTTAIVTMAGHATEGKAVVKSSATGKYECARKGDSPVYRMELTNTVTRTVGATETRTEQRITRICDGRYVHELVEVEARKLAVATKSDLEPQQLFDPVSVFSRLRKTHSLKLLPQDSTDGQKTYVVEATVQQAHRSPASRLVFYFLQQHGVLTKLVLYDRAGRPVGTVTFSNFKYDVDLDPGRFVFQAPPGVKVMDLTGSTP